MKSVEMQRQGAIAAFWAVGIAFGSAGMPTFAQTSVATVLLKQDGEVSVAPEEAAIIRSFGQPAANRSGGLGVIVMAEREPSPPLARRRFHLVWGSGDADESSPDVMMSEAVLGIPGTNWVAGSLERPFGLSNPLPESTALVTTSVALTKMPFGEGDPSDGLLNDHIHGFVDSLFVGKGVVLRAGDAADPSPTGLPQSSTGWYWTYFSNPVMTADGRPVWKGGLSTDPSGSTIVSGLFILDAGLCVPIFIGGTSVSGLPLDAELDAVDPVGDFGVGAIGKDWIAHVRFAHASGPESMTAANDEAIVLLPMTGPPEMLAREGELVNATGAMAGETWRSFKLCGVSRAGTGEFHIYVVGQTTAGSAGARGAVVVLDGAVSARTGLGVDGVILGNAVPHAAMNSSGDLATVWHTGSAGAQAGAVLLVNSAVILKSGDALDFVGAPVTNLGDGIADPEWTLNGFAGRDSISLSDRTPASPTTSSISVCFAGYAGSTESRNRAGFFTVSITDGGTVTCPGDWNQVDGLDSQDFFDYMNDFFTGNGDFNGDGFTDSQDLFDFLDAFFAGCA